jgi:hypothetical protein
MPHGLTYEGDFLNDLFHGTGSCKNNNNCSSLADIIYCESAKWNKGQLEGYVKIIYANKDIYIGNYYNNQPHGKGTMKFHYKTTYTGDFSKGAATGRGYIYYNNGDIYKGHCLNGLPHGLGTILYTNGDSYKGSWSQGIRQQQQSHDDTIDDSRKRIIIPKPVARTLKLSSYTQDVIDEAINKILFTT